MAKQRFIEIELQFILDMLKSQDYTAVQAIHSDIPMDAKVVRGSIPTHYSQSPGVLMVVIESEEFVDIPDKEPLPTWMPTATSIMRPTDG